MIHTRTFAAELHARDDSREFVGTLVPYGQQATVTEFGRTYVEDFAPGALAADVARAGEVELMALHPRSGAEMPVGITVELLDTPAGLDGRWRVSETEFGNDVLTLVRDKALRFLSAGFTEGRNQWHTRERVTRVTASLDHAALVRRPAYTGARLRGAQGQHDPLLLLARLRLR